MSNSVREKLEEYFTSMNPTSNRMMSDIMSFRQKHVGEWNSLPEEEQSEKLWHSLVKEDALKKYEKIPAEKLDVEYYPVLRTRPGEKIIVDEDTTSGRPFGCTWRDEHSAPFRWETQSQLDLRLSSEDLEDDNVKTLEKPQAKPVEQEKSEVKKEEEVKHPPAAVKRPGVPPPPVPPHAASPPVPPHAETPTASPPPVDKSDTPIYAKVVKRKSANAKTLVISELKAHRKAKEDMKPAVPPRMSLELRGEVDITKYKTLPIDFDDIPKTGFDFLDNW